MLGPLLILVDTVSGKDMKNVIKFSIGRLRNAGGYKLVFIICSKFDNMKSVRQGEEEIHKRAI